MNTSFAVLLLFLVFVFVLLLGRGLIAINVAMWWWWHYGRRYPSLTATPEDAFVPSYVQQGLFPLGLMALVLMLAGAALGVVGLATDMEYLQHAGTFIAYPIFIFFVWFGIAKMFSTADVGCLLSPLLLFRLFLPKEKEENIEKKLHSLSQKIREGASEALLIALYQRYWKAGLELRAGAALYEQRYVEWYVERYANQDGPVAVARRLMEDLDAVLEHPEVDKHLLSKCRQLKREVRKRLHIAIGDVERIRKKRTRQCPDCKAELPSKGVLECVTCGFSWHNCPECSHAWKQSHTLCHNCGYDLFVAMGGCSDAAVSEDLPNGPSEVSLTPTSQPAEVAAKSASERPESPAVEQQSHDSSEKPVSDAASEMPPDSAAKALLSEVHRCLVGYTDHHLYVPAAHSASAWP